MRLWLLPVLALLAPAASAVASTEAVTRLILRFEEPAAAARRAPSAAQSALLAGAGGRGLYQRRALGGGARLLALPAPLTPAAAESLAESLAAQPGVRYAHPDYRRRPALHQLPNDSRFAEQWYLRGPADGSQPEPGGSNTTGAWDLTDGAGAAAVIAVLDTGIRPHPELSGRLAADEGDGVSGFDFVSADDSPAGLQFGTANDGDGRDGDPADPGDWLDAGVRAQFPGVFDGCPDSPASSWHGTAVAGILGAAAEDGNPTVGIHQEARILPVRVLGRCGGYVSDIADGIRWAAGLEVPGAPLNPTPARIINLSFGAPGDCSAAEQEAIDAAAATGALVVVAAGNDTADATASAPGNCASTFTVAASRRDGGRTGYSNYDGVNQPPGQRRVIALSAPGGDAGLGGNGILAPSDAGATTPAGAAYQLFVGTSFAAPMVSATAALLLSLDPDLDGEALDAQLRAGARPFPQGTGADCSAAACGAGLLDGARALDLDGDGLANAADLDDDGDGSADAEDPFPLDPTRAAEATDPDAGAGPVAGDPGNAGGAGSGGGGGALAGLLALAVPAWRRRRKGSAAAGARGGPALWLSLAALVAAPAWLPARAETISRLVVQFDSEQPARRQATGVRIQALAVVAGRPLQGLRRLAGGAELVDLGGALERAEVEALARELAAQPGVLYAHPDYRRKPTLVVPSDRSFGAQWYLQPATSEPGSANVQPAWDLSTGQGAPVVVAVLDTGLRPHPELTQRLAGDGSADGIAGHDFVSADPSGTFVTANDGDGRDGDPTDPGDGVTRAARIQFPVELGDCAVLPSSWHGTAVAGIVGAAADNDDPGLAEGTVGIHLDARILPVRVLGRCGGFVSDIAEAIRWAAGLPVAGVATIPAGQQARVINLSFGLAGPCTALEQSAIDAAIRVGALVVAAAGNDNGGEAADSAPGNCRRVLTVAASTRQGGRTGYTNYNIAGTAVELVAPGGNNDLIDVEDNILAPSDSGTIAPAAPDYRLYAGTSFSAPVVSGAAALVLALNPRFGPSCVYDTLLETARAFPVGTDDGAADCTTATCGTGIVDAGAALQRVAAGPPGDCGSTTLKPPSGGGGGAIAGWLLLAAAFAFRRRRW